MKMLKVMLADDEVTILTGFKQLFNWEKYGYEIVCEANDGVQAVNLADEYNPDIIIMDINMPLMSGLEAIQVIGDKHPQTAFVIVSGYDEFGYARQALRLGVVDYMLKPIKFEELSDVLEKLRLRLMKDEPNDEAATVGAQIEMPIYKIVGYINEHMSEPITLQSLSDEFHLNASYISQLFKNETGMNYHRYLTRLRINKAKTLLVGTGMSISDVALAVGFNDYRIFAKVFKQQEHILPSQYRAPKKRPTK